MKQVSIQFFNGEGCCKPVFVVRIDPLPLTTAFCEQPYFGIRIPTAMVDPGTAIIRFTVERIARRFPAGLQALDTGPESVGQYLIGIKRKYMVELGQVQRMIFLLDVSLECVLNEACSFLLADRFSSVRGEGVHDKDFVSDSGQGIEATADVGLLVKRDDDDR